MTNNIEKIPLVETIIEKAVFINQDITLYTNRDCSVTPNDLDRTVKFLFGEGAHIVLDNDNGYMGLTIKDASYVIRNAQTTNAKWTQRIIE